MPAGFSEKQRAAIRTAAEKAGFAFVKLLDESAALILGAGIKDEGKAFLVYSLGGGFFTVSIFRISNGLPKALCHEGDRKLGGYNFDLALMHHLFNISGSGFALSSKRYASIYKLKSLAEQLKIGLSKREQVEIDLDFNDYLDMGLEHNIKSKFKHVLSRTDFENIISKDVEKTLSLTNKAIQGAGLTKDDIESIMLAGGSTKIPYIEQMLSDQFGKKIVRLSNETILKGAAIYGIELPEPSVEKSCGQVNQEGGAATVQKNEAYEESDSENKYKHMWLNEFPRNLMNAQSMWTKGNQEKSIAILEEMSVQLTKFIGNMHSTRGKMFMQLNDFDHAMLCFEGALRHIKDDKNAKHAYHKACSNKGRLLAKKGVLQEAATVIKKGLVVEPDCRGCSEFLKDIEDALRSKRSSGEFRQRKKKR